MNIIPKLTAVALCSMVAMSTASHATLFETGNPGGSFILGTGWEGQGDDRTLDILWFVNPGFANQSFSLSSVGDMATFDFGIAEFTGESSISQSEMDNLEIAAKIDLDLPGGLSLTSVGTAVPVAGTTADADIDVTVTFAATNIAFGNTGLLGLELSSVIFTDDHSEAEIEAKFTLLQADTQQTVSNPPSTDVSEPATLGLFGLGLMGLGFVRRKRSA